MNQERGVCVATRITRIGGAGSGRRETEGGEARGLERMDQRKKRWLHLRQRKGRKKTIAIRTNSSRPRRRERRICSLRHTGHFI
jgi:hypothetical protein